MIFELDQKRVGNWDQFQVRKIGLRMQGRKFESLLSLVPGWSRWRAVEQERLKRIIRAKGDAEETTYLKLMRRHERLRAEIIKLGS
jgi:hypothetical protein